jgi:hypothetical protein
LGDNNRRETIIKTGKRVAAIRTGGDWGRLRPSNARSHLATRAPTAAAIKPGPNQHGSTFACLLLLLLPSSLLQKLTLPRPTSSWFCRRVRPPCGWARQRVQAFSHFPSRAPAAERAYVAVEMGRAPCCDKASVKRGPWSPEEDELLRSYVQNHGTGGNWIALPHKAGACVSILLCRRPV